jgi:hypothetical protein
MIRGRHRGLPVAIDRAVMLPAEFTEAFDSTNEDVQQRQFKSGDEKNNGQLTREPMAMEGKP